MKWLFPPFQLNHWMQHRKRWCFSAELYNSVYSSFQLKLWLRDLHRIQILSADILAGWNISVSAEPVLITYSQFQLNHGFHWGTLFSWLYLSGLCSMWSYCAIFLMFKEVPGDSTKWFSHIYRIVIQSWGTRPRFIFKCQEKLYIAYYKTGRL